MAEAAQLVPPVVWAQRRDRLLLTIDLQDSKDHKFNLQNDADAKHGKLTFSCRAVSHATGPVPHSYLLELEFYGPIDTEESKTSINSRYILLVIAKKSADAGHWPRLLAQSGKPPPNVKVDWNKWVDEDEEDTVPDTMDLGDLQNFTNFSDAAGGDDSDDDLEK